MYFSNSLNVFWRGQGHRQLTTGYLQLQQSDIVSHTTLLKCDLLSPRTVWDYTGKRCIAYLKDEETQVHTQKPCLQSFHRRKHRILKRMTLTLSSRDLVAKEIQLSTHILSSRLHFISNSIIRNTLGNCTPIYCKNHSLNNSHEFYQV